MDGDPDPAAFARGRYAIAVRWSFLPTLVVRSGARAAERVARATRIDDAVEVVAEETIVRAVESEAVERAIRRVLAGPLVEDAVENGT